MAPKDNEKKLMNEKVAQVRQVVDNATNNDIIMVLHSFDLDVNKTIQAFCEDGASSILGDWVTSGGTSVADAKKKKKNKNKSKTPAASESAPVAVAPATSAASTAPAQAQPKQAPKTAVPVHQEPASIAKPASNAAPKPAVNGASASNDPLSLAFKALRVSLNDREKALKQILSSNPKSTISLDTSAIINLISTFGESEKSSVSKGKPATQAKVAPKTDSPPPATASIKHATSQSSINSSVGADSGVNLSPTHKEEKKAVAPAKPQTVVSNGGLQMTSDGLTAAQMAAIQLTLHQQLAARGLDASVLTSSENVSRRPRNNKNEKKGGAKKQKDQQPKLSIL